MIGKIRNFFLCVSLLQKYVLDPNHDMLEVVHEGDLLGEPEKIVGESLERTIP